MISFRLLPIAFCLAGAIHGADSKKPVFQVPNSKEEAPPPEDRQGTLKPGEELFYDYGLIIDDRYTPKLKKQYACRCGSKQCRGTMLAPKR